MTRTIGKRNEFLPAVRLPDELYIRLSLSVPSKKNQWRSAASHVYLPAHVSAMLDALELLLTAEWARRSAPLVHPDITVRFGVSNLLLDRTNLYQAVEDCMVRAGILADDSISVCNGALSYLSAEHVAPGEEFVELWIR